MVDDYTAMWPTGWACQIDWDFNFLLVSEDLMMTRRSMPILLMSWFLRGQTATSDAAWSRFLDWLQTQTEVRGGTPGVMSAYQQKLIANGMPQAEAEALVAGFQSRARTDPDFQGATFNRIYSRSEDNASRTVLPNAFLAETIADRRPGTALDVGMGVGRNTIFLAQKGWEATGIDLSNIGVNKAQERARSLGVHINALVADVNCFDLGTKQWDLICLLYFIINDGGMPNLRQRIATALKPGGLVIAEGFGLPAIDTLLAERSNWEPTKLKLLRMEYRQGAADWGGNEISRLLLQRPA